MWWNNRRLHVNIIKYGFTELFASSGLGAFSLLSLSSKVSFTSLFSAWFRFKWLLKLVVPPPFPPDFTILLHILHVALPLSDFIKKFPNKRLLYFRYCKNMFLFIYIYFKSMLEIKCKQWKKIFYLWNKIMWVKRIEERREKKKGKKNIIKN